MLLLIDNYDSFTFNLVHYLGELGAEVVVRRNDALDVQAAMALRPEAIVLSPGPCDPDRAGICLPLILAAAETGTPLLGVCLGHQAIGQAFGGKVVRCHEIVHGKLGRVQPCRRRDLRRPAVAVLGDPLSFAGGRPRQPARLPGGYRLVEDGTIMGLQAPRPCRSRGCSSTPKASPRSMATSCCATFLDRLPVAA